MAILAIMVLRAHGLSARVGSVNARIGVLVWPHGAAGLAWHSHVVALPLVRALVREHV